ncbi:MAG: Flp family type IVb pilin [Proteobacteria bacterium]|nr:Flp family type IVb pilin [Pseudomonadota bacterium]
MGEAARPDAISHAGSRPAAHPHAARSAVKRFLADENGATAIEYAMIAAGIAVVIVAAVNTLGQNVKDAFFNKLASATAAKTP